MKVINIGDMVYYARISHNTGTYDLCDLRVRTVYDDSFVGVDRQTKRAFILGFNECDVSVFDDRDIALAKVHEAEKLKQDFTLDRDEYE